MKALITGITGQDGSYLAELLLAKNYEVHGIVRRHAVDSNRHKNIQHIANQIQLHEGDLLDESGIFNIVNDLQPNEIYNLAAQSHVGVSSSVPIYTTKVNALGPLILLEAIRQFVPTCKFYQASSSEQFGNSYEEDSYQKESTVMKPVSPYACAKLFAFNIVRHYRVAFKLFACNGILFNHESPRRGDDFVTQKIVKAAKAIRGGTQDKLVLGNLDSARDWSHAIDMVNGMYLIMQHDTPIDCILSSGECHTVREFCDIVFRKCGLDYRTYVVLDPELMRKEELKYLRGDCSKAKSLLGWNPVYSFDDLIEDMIYYA